VLDFDLAEIYQVPTKRLKEQVKRNIERFPNDFMFQLSDEEWKELVANCDQLPNSIKHSYIIPLAFTQEGVAMMSGVLRSQKAIRENIKIMRVKKNLKNQATQ
jgi:preprotein translocase subunit SecA